MRHLSKKNVLTTFTLQSMADLHPAQPKLQLFAEIVLPRHQLYLQPLGTKLQVWEYSCVGEYFIKSYKGIFLKYSLLLAVLPRNWLDLIQFWEWSIFWAREWDLRWYYKDEGMQKPKHMQDLRHWNPLQYINVFKNAKPRVCYNLQLLYEM